MTDAVLGNTYDLPASDFAKIRRDTTDRRLAARTGDPVMPSKAAFDDPHKFAVGSARLARLQFWSALKDLSMYSLRIREDGMRAALASDHRRDGLCPRRFGPDDGDGTRRHA
jgi:oxalate decarboxylase